MKLRIDHSNHDHPATKVARALCRKEMAAAPKVETTPGKMTKVKVYNMSNGDVEVHAPGCADPRKKDSMADHFTASFDSIHAIWEDYNADFIDEGEDATHTIHVYKCTGMTDRKVSYNA